MWSQLQKVLEGNGSRIILPHNTVICTTQSLLVFWNESSTRKRYSVVKLPAKAVDILKNHLLLYPCWCRKPSPHSPLSATWKTTWSCFHVLCFYSCPQTCWWWKLSPHSLFSAWSCCKRLWNNHCVNFHPREHVEKAVHLVQSSGGILKVHWSSDEKARLVMSSSSEHPTSSRQRVEIACSTLAMKSVPCLKVSLCVHTSLLHAMTTVIYVPSSRNTPKPSVHEIWQL